MRDIGTDGGEEAGWRRRHWSAGNVGERPWLNDQAGEAGRGSRWGQWHGEKVHETGDGKSRRRWPRKSDNKFRLERGLCLGKLKERQLWGREVINNR